MKNNKINLPVNPVKKPSLFQKIKKNVIVFSFCINVLMCFASCAYFGAAESKMREVRDLQRAREFADGVLETPDLTGNFSIEELEDAVEQDLKDMKMEKPKRSKARPLNG